MANVSVYNTDGKEVGTIELNDAVFGVELNEHMYIWLWLHSSPISARARRRRRPAPRFPEAAESRGDRRVPVTQDRVPRDLRSGRAAE